MKEKVRTLALWAVPGFPLDERGYLLLPEPSWHALLKAACKATATAKVGLTQEDLGTGIFLWEGALRQLPAENPLAPLRNKPLEPTWLAHPLEELFQAAQNLEGERTWDGVTLEAAAVERGKAVLAFRLHREATAGITHLDLGWLEEGS